MRRPVLIATLLAALLVPAGAADAHRAGKRVDGVPLAAASLDACVTASDPANRYATFVGQMTALKGTAEMALRFDLDVRGPGTGGWARVRGPGLGEWFRSSPGVDIFRYRKQVTNLSSPSSYRAVVRFRWYDADGDVVHRETRRSDACRQPDQRPDLVVGAVAVAPGSQPGLGRYVVTVRNDGRGDAGPFGVALRIAGDEHAVGVVGLLHGESRDVEVLGPACSAGGTVRAVVDPEARVDESAEGNNALRVDCPLG